MSNKQQAVRIADNLAKAIDEAINFLDANELTEDAVAALYELIFPMPALLPEELACKLEELHKRYS